MRLLFLFLASLLGFVISSAAWSSDLIISRSVLEDRTGTLTIDEVTQADFVPASPMLSKGYTNSVHWIRLRIKAPKDDSTIELRIRPTFLDEVFLYEPDPSKPNRWVSRVTGDLMPYAMRDRPAVTLGFLVHMHAQESTYYLRLKTTSSSLMNVEALTPKEANTKDVRLDMFQALYLGFMLWLLFWAANDYVGGRQRLVGLFLLFQACYTLYTLAVMGYLAVLIPYAPLGWIDKLTSILVCLSPLLILVFHRMLLSMFAPPRRTIHILDALIFMGLIALTMLVLGYTHQALQLNALVILLAAPVFVGLAFASSTNAPPGLRVIRIIYILQGLSLLASMLPLLGLVRATEWNLQATFIHGFVSTFLMFLILPIRSREMSRQAWQAELDLELLRQQLTLEQKQKQQQERFVAMLTHELKTPMSVIRIVLATLNLDESAKLRSKRALKDMNEIIEHCQRVDQLEQGQLATHTTRCSIEELLGELKSASGAPQRLLIEAQGLPEITTDRQLLSIVLNNLISNAMKYAAKASDISLRATPCERAGKSGVLVVVRNKPGLAGLPDASKVFNKYYRSPGAHRKTGAGLGLYLVKSYVELLGGEVAYRDVEGHAEFSIWMPC